MCMGVRICMGERRATLYVMCACPPRTDACLPLSLSLFISLPFLFFSFVLFFLSVCCSLLSLFCLCLCVSAPWLLAPLPLSLVNVFCIYAYGFSAVGACACVHMCMCVYVCMDVCGKYGTRYGASLRKQIKRVEISQHARYVCPFCGKVCISLALVHAYLCA